MEDIKLTAEKRPAKGTKKELSALRARLRVPGVVYGEGKPEILVTVAEKDVLAARKQGGVNAILHLELGGATETVIVKDLQKHPVSERLWHADFQRISLSRKITAKVPLHIKGEAPGVKNSGGVLQHELRELTLKALPTKIPQFIEVDVSNLELHKHILVKELPLGPDVEVLEDLEHIVVHVTIAKVEEAEPVPGAAEAVAAAGAVPAEPELSAVKGKKDEDGKPLPKDAKDAKETKDAKGKDAKGSGGGAAAPAKK
ncbi:MAG TPA: 50S ribosomal protein L25 [Elusimicrobiota bacterium]|nr:50S ribosomal protein L25 [Elusimicrobiota bacterium]